MQNFKSLNLKRSNVLYTVVIPTNLSYVAMVLNHRNQRCEIQLLRSVNFKTSDQMWTSPIKLWAVMGSAVWRNWQVILLGLKFVKQEILSTPFIDFYYKLGELRSIYLNHWINLFQIHAETKQKLSCVVVAYISVSVQSCIKGMRFDQCCKCTKENWSAVTVSTKKWCGTLITGNKKPKLVIFMSTVEGGGGEGLY